MKAASTTCHITIQWSTTANAAAVDAIAVTDDDTIAYVCGGLIWNSIMWTGSVPIE